MNWRSIDEGLRPAPVLISYDRSGSLAPAEMERFICEMQRLTTEYRATQAMEEIAALFEGREPRDMRVSFKMEELP